MLQALSDLLLSRPQTGEDRTIQNALKDYFALKIASDFGESALGGIFGGDNLGRENQRLDIELKKRQLNAMGPQDTQTFNDTPAPRLLAALGIEWAKDLKPNSSGIGAAKDSGLFKLGSAFGHEAKEIGIGTKYLGGLGGHGGPAGLAAKLFG